MGILFDHNLAKENYSTFTAICPDEPRSETPFIDRFRVKYNFENHRTYPTGKANYENFQRFMEVQEEPCSAAAFYTQYEVMRLAKEKGVTVLLDGQGADEVFAGYHYFHAFYMHGKIKQRQYGRLLQSFYQTLARKQKKIAFQTFLFNYLPTALKKRILRNTDPYLSEEFFDKYLKQSMVFQKFMQPEDLNTNLARHFQYKLEHLLNAEDRNSMAFSIETRVPYLDYRLVEYVLSLSDDLKINAGETKYIQKMAVGHYSSKEICERKDKIGFLTPTELWMKAPYWQEMAEEAHVYVKSMFPGIFSKDAQMPRNGFKVWKIIQVYMWHKLLHSIPSTYEYSDRREAVRQ